MGIYSNISIDEINKILTYYDFSPVESFSPTITGISNSNFKVNLKSHESVLLKISNDKTLSQLSNEQMVLSVLQKYNYKYSIHPFKTLLGKSIYHVDEYFGVIFPFVDGTPPPITSVTCYGIGKALSLLHSLEIEKEDLDLVRHHDLVGYSGESILDYVSTSECPRDYKDSFHEIFKDRLEKLPFDLFPSGIIHGDLYFDNVLFKGDKLITLIDFEQSGRGHYLLDIGISLSGCCFNEDRTNLDLNLINAFMSGYEEQRKLIKIEKEFLFESILIGFFSIGLWRIKRFYEGNLDESKKFNYRELLERASNFYAKYIR